MKKLTYKEAGVDVESSDLFKGNLKKILKYSKYVIEGVGPFASVLKIPSQQGCLVMSCDGVGTKLKFASEFGQYKTVGIDLVAMSVNDVLCMNAKPYFFLDYIGINLFDRRVLDEIIKGISIGCELAGCCLVGGETAQMPEFYSDNYFELVGFAVGFVNKKNLPRIEEVREGDIILGLDSSGLHSNGFSLVRKILERKKELSNLKKIILTPTRIYVRDFFEIVKVLGYPKTSAHITGGGIMGNIKRVIPKSRKIVIFKENLKKHKTFEILQKEGDIDEEEMFSVFNMGLGFSMLYDRNKLRKINNLIGSKKIRGLRIVGEVV